MTGWDQWDRIVVEDEVCDETIVEVGVGMW